MDDVTTDRYGDLPRYILLRPFYSFSDGLLSHVHDNWINKDVEVSDGGELHNNSACIFNLYIDDELT